jgi:B-box zinc finger.
MNERFLLDQATGCANHSGAAAEAICSACGKPLCADCFVQLSTGIACDDPGHKIVLEEWAITFRSNSEFEVDMIVKNLENNRVASKMFSSRDRKNVV